jgi:hypothetical protein
LVAGGTGDAYVVWLDGGLPHASRLTASGALAASWTDGGLALSNSEYGSDQLAVTSDGEQGALVTWEEGVMPDGWYESVQVQRLSRAGIWDGVVATEDALPDSCVAPRQPVVEGFRPNPTHVSTATVMFSLPQDGTVRIELFDLSGRRVGEQDAGFLVAGRHTIPLHVGHSTPPGVYFVRMTQAGRSAMARGVVLP